MPLWGWIALFVVLSAIMIPIKLKILKKMTSQKNSSYTDEE